MADDFTHAEIEQEAHRTKYGGLDEHYQRAYRRLGRWGALLPRSLLLRRLMKERTAKLDRRIIELLVEIDAEEASIDEQRKHMFDPPPPASPGYRPPADPVGRMKAVIAYREEQLDEVRQRAKAAFEELAMLELGEERRRSVTWRWITLAIAIAGVVLNFVRHH